MDENSIINRLRGWAGLPILIITVVLVIINTIYSDNFLSRGVLEGFFATYAPLVLCALAQSMVLMGGGIDLSVGGVVSLSNVVTIVLVTAGWDFFKVGQAEGMYLQQTIGSEAVGWPFWAAACGGIFAGMLIGALNGFAVAVLRIRPLLATLSTLFVGSGAALFVLPLPGGMLPMDVVNWYIEPSLFLPKGLWVILLGMAFWVLVMATPYGVHLRAVGRDPARAYASGSPVVWIQFWSYVLNAFLGAAGGVALTLTITAGDPLVGAPFTLNSIAAAVLGGVALGGGKGEVGGPVCGAIFLGLIVNTVLSTGVPPWYQWLVSGVIILLGLAGTMLIQKTGLIGEK